MDAKKSDANQLGSPLDMQPAPGADALCAEGQFADDRALLARAAVGEQAAWETLYHRLTARLHVRAGRLLAKHGPGHGAGATRQQTEDLVHSAWQHLFIQRQVISSDFDPKEGSLEAFLLTIAYRQMVSVLRSKARRPWLPGSGNEPEAEKMSAKTASPEDQAESRQALLKLQGCMAQELASTDVDLLLRIYLGDEDIAKLAAERQMTRATLDQRMSRARRRLRKCLETLGFSP